MLISKIDPDTLSREDITRVLFGDGPAGGGNGDCIFVFGGRGSQRVVKAVELYQAERAPLILFSGGTRRGKYRPAQAIQMRKHAAALGVPEDAMEAECESNDTTENVKLSLPVLDGKLGLPNVRRLLVVSIPWHRRRGLLTWRTHAPDWIEYAWCPAAYPDHQPDNWWQTPEVERYVMGELRTLVTYVRKGKLRDEEV